MKWHRFASVPPMLPDDELQALADDIRKHGLKMPVVTFEGEVLDGRNRLAACTLAGVDPVFTAFTGTVADALAHARSLNGKRRHETSGQRAVADATYAKYEKECADAVAAMEAEAAKRKTAGLKRGSVGERIPPREDAGKVRDQRAKAAGTNPKYIDAADEVVENDPDLAQQVLDGTKTLPEAARESKSRKEAAAPVAKKAEVVTESKRQVEFITREVEELKRRVLTFAKTKAGAFVNAALVNRTLKELRQELHRAVLAQPCEKCSGKGCMLCKEVGFVTSGHYE